MLSRGICLGLGVGTTLAAHKVWTSYKNQMIEDQKLKDIGNRFENYQQSHRAVIAKMLQTSHETVRPYTLNEIKEHEKQIA